MEGSSGNYAVLPIIMLLHVTIRLFLRTTSITSPTPTDMESFDEKYISVRVHYESEPMEESAPHESTPFQQQMSHYAQEAIEGMIAAYQTAKEKKRVREARQRAWWNAVIKGEMPPSKSPLFYTSPKSFDQDAWRAKMSYWMRWVDEDKAEAWMKNVERKMEKYAQKYNC